MIRQVLIVGGLVAVILTLTVLAAIRVGGRVERERPPMPASPSPMLRPPAGALLTEADFDFDGVYAYLAEQRREGSR